MVAAPQTAQSAAPRSVRAMSFNARQLAPYAIVGVGVIAYVIYRRMSSRALNPAGRTIEQTPAAAAQDSPSASDIAQQIVDLQGAASTPPAPADNGMYQPPKGEKLVGSGFTSPPNSLLVKDASGSTFQGIVSNISAGELKKAGEILYYQVLPGVFEPAKGTLRPGTSLFYKQKA
jgi:hypothetical protein